MERIIGNKVRVPENPRYQCVQLADSIDRDVTLPLGEATNVVRFGARPVRGALGANVLGEGASSEPLESEGEWIEVAPPRIILANEGQGGAEQGQEILDGNKVPHLLLRYPEDRLLPATNDSFKSGRYLVTTERVCCEQVLHH